MPSDLPDYTRLVNVSVAVPDVNVGPVKAAKYQASPADLPDGTWTPILTDVKGRPIVIVYGSVSLASLQEIIVRPKGGILAKGSVTATSAYQTVASRTVTAGKQFQLSKVLISARKAAWVVYRWGSAAISAERLLDDKTILVEHFPWDYYPMAGDGAKAFDVRAKYDTEADTVNVEIVGEEV